MMMTTRVPRPMYIPVLLSLALPLAYPQDPDSNHPRLLLGRADVHGDRLGHS